MRRSTFASLHQVGKRGLHLRQPQVAGRAAGLKPKAQALLAVLASDPFQNPPPYEKLVGDLAGTSSRRINIQHRLVYEVFPERRTVRVLPMWTHYE